MNRKKDFSGSRLAPDHSLLPQGLMSSHQHHGIADYITGTTATARWVIAPPASAFSMAPSAS
jgi:hypothetical protein